MICRIIGHKLNPEFTQPEDRFQQLWNEWLHETLWYEVFEQECLRCHKIFRIWRWTIDAAAKEAGMINEGR